VNRAITIALKKMELKNRFTSIQLKILADNKKGRANQQKRANSPQSEQIVLSLSLSKKILLSRKNGAKP